MTLAYNDGVLLFIRDCGLIQTSSQSKEPAEFIYKGIKIAQSMRLLHSLDLPIKQYLLLAPYYRIFGLLQF